MTLEEYRQDPCGALSIPYWKAKEITVPPSMQIIHARDFSEELLWDYADERYFRLKHDLQSVEPVILPGFQIRAVQERDIPAVAEVINRSYRDISVTCEQLYRQRQAAVFREELWILAWDVERDCAVGCGIAELDTEAGEGALEWIQVLPEYRRRHIGMLLVQELLGCMKGRAQFATVSGRCQEPTQPEQLYRACGFQGNDIWYILRKR